MKVHFFEGILFWQIYFLSFVHTMVRSGVVSTKLLLLVEFQAQKHKNSEVFSLL